MTTILLFVVHFLSSVFFPKEKRFANDCPFPPRSSTLVPVLPVRAWWGGRDLSRGCVVYATVGEYATAGEYSFRSPGPSSGVLGCVLCGRETQGIPSTRVMHACLLGGEGWEEMEGGIVELITAD
eukprot:Hpha_TRINITY_DN15721_c3_g3::TRINITY_DN15721_c3_g3_i4::g.39483::m.39483